MVVIEGKIRGKARPRVCNGHAFTPKQTVEYERLVKVCYTQQDGRHLKGDLRAVIIANYKIPKSYTKKRIQRIREGVEYPCKKPDVDNIAKIILDALNKVAYDDDKQVIELTVLKRYTEDKERVEVELSELV